MKPALSQSSLHGSATGSAQNRDVARSDGSTHTHTSARPHKHTLMNLDFNTNWPVALGNKRRRGGVLAVI